MSTPSKSRRHPALALLFPPSAPEVSLSNVSRFMSSAGGLDKSLMLLQYPARMIVPALLLLARRISQSTALRLDVRKQLSSRLVALVQRLNNLAGAVGDARTMMRLFGLIPILAALKRIILGSAPAFDTTDSAISTLQLITLLCYYPLENLSYLSSKGAIGLSKAREGRWSLWSVRFWAAYVMLDLWALKRRRDALNVREKAARVEGKEEKEGDEARQTLNGDWEQWTEEVMVNVGYAPLTVHWSVPSGLWSNAGWTGLFGTIACVSGIRSSWRGMAV